MNSSEDLIKKEIKQLESLFENLPDSEKARLDETIELIPTIESQQNINGMNFHSHFNPPDNFHVPRKIRFMS